MANRSSPEARLFWVVTRFNTLTRREGGIPRDKAIEQAQDQIGRAAIGFDQWLGDELRQLTSLIADVESGKPEVDWLERANTGSRQLCESSGTLGFQLLSFVAGSLCDALDSIQAGAECNMEMIACHIDALNLTAGKSYRRLQPEQVPELTEGLRQVARFRRTSNGYRTVG